MRSHRPHPLRAGPANNITFDTVYKTLHKYFIEPIADPLSHVRSRAAGYSSTHRPPPSLHRRRHPRDGLHLPSTLLGLRAAGCAAVLYRRAAFAPQAARRIWTYH